MASSRIAICLLLLAACGSTVTAFTIEPTQSYRPRLPTLLHSTASAAAPSLPDGLTKTITVPGTGDPVRLGDIATIRYSASVPNTNNNAVTAAPFARAERQKVVVGGTLMIPGWESAVRTMRVGERSTVLIDDPALAYGTAGVPPVVPPQSKVLLELEVLECVSATQNIDFDMLANADETPRTATDIAAAFERRQLELAEQGPGLEGLEKWIAKAKNFYFYGLFEGETGERPPWFLRPSITFPLAFLIVGAAFWVSFASGAITERGAQKTDELDELILSSTAVYSTIVTALASNTALPL